MARTLDDIMRRQKRLRELAQQGQGSQQNMQGLQSLQEGQGLKQNWAGFGKGYAQDKTATETAFVPGAETRVNASPLDANSYVAPDNNPVPDNVVPDGGQGSDDDNPQNGSGQQGGGQGQGGQPGPSNQAPAPQSPVVGPQISQRVRELPQGTTGADYHIVRREDIGKNGVTPQDVNRGLILGKDGQLYSRAPYDISKPHQIKPYDAQLAKEGKISEITVEDVAKGLATVDDYNHWRHINKETGDIYDPNSNRPGDLKPVNEEAMINGEIKIIKDGEWVTADPNKAEDVNEVGNMIKEGRLYSPSTGMTFDPQDKLRDYNKDTEGQTFTFEEVKPGESKGGEGNINTVDIRKQEPAERPGKPKYDELPKEQDYSTIKGLDYTSMLNQMFRPPTEEELAQERKRRRRDAMFAAIGDGISSLSNLFFTSKGSPNAYDGKNSLSAGYADRWDKMDQEMRENMRWYVPMYMQAMKLGEDSTNKQRDWAHQLYRDKVGDIQKENDQKLERYKTDLGAYQYDRSQNETERANQKREEQTDTQIAQADKHHQMDFEQRDRHQDQNIEQRIADRKESARQFDARISYDRWAKSQEIATARERLRNESYWNQMNYNARMAEISNKSSDNNTWIPFGDGDGAYVPNNKINKSTLANIYSKLPESIRKQVQTKKNSYGLDYVDPAVPSVDDMMWAIGTYAGSDWDTNFACRNAVMALAGGRRSRNRGRGY